MSRLRNRPKYFSPTITHYAKSLTPISLYDDNIITFRIESSRESECFRSISSPQISELLIFDETVHIRQSGISGVNFNTPLKIELSAG